MVGYGRLPFDAGTMLSNLRNIQSMANITLLHQDSSQDL